VALAPFVAYVEAIDARQGWYMFTAPDRRPQRFVLRAATRTGELPLFELGKPSEPQAFDQAFLDQHRVRRALFQAAWSDRPVFDEVCSWFAREASPRVSGLTHVTCQLVEEPVLSPADAGAPLRSPSRAPRVVRTVRFDSKGTRRK
jgi:hypothetical protein